MAEAAQIRRERLTAEIRRIISRKVAHGRVPACCTLPELMEAAYRSELRPDRDEALAAMRSMHRRDGYRCAININRIPMVLLHQPDIKE